MKTLLASIGAMFTASQAFAFQDQTCASEAYRALLKAAGDFTTCANAVPEISAMEGTAALAAIAAIVLITWERRRRAAA